MGSFRIPIPNPTGVMVIQADVVKADVPILVGLDALDQHILQPLSVTNKLQHISHHGADPYLDNDWNLDLIRSDGHLYLPFILITQAHSAFYASSQLEKRRRSFYHPSAAQLYELLKRADSEQPDQETRKILQEISQTCTAWKWYSSVPLSFRITLPGESRLNRQTRLDLCWIEDQGESHPVLRIIDTATKVQIASFYLQKT